MKESCNKCKTTGLWYGDICPDCDGYGHTVHYPSKED